MIATAMTNPYNTNPIRKMISVISLSKVQSFLGKTSYCLNLFTNRLLKRLFLVLFAIGPQAWAADLMIEDGVVVKFGADAQLVVRDRMLFGKAITLTSQKDDAVGGKLGATPQVAAVGDWSGLRLEKSSVDYGSINLNDITLRYAGAIVGNKATAALTVRAGNPSYQFIQITDSAVGLRLLNGVNPTITDSSFLRNNVGIEADEDSAATITSTQFAGNATVAINNTTPATIIEAVGNWWGHSTGPKQTIANPQGLGDIVSIGVNTSNFLVSAPLLNPNIRLAAPAPYYDKHSVLLDFSCVNATEYRIAEGNAFGGVAFQALVNGRGQTTFITSDGDGRKVVNIQFRNASGVVTTASLIGGVLIDTQAPLVTITNPASGSVISQPITIEAQAVDGAGLLQLQFFIDNVLVNSLSNSPYTHFWDTALSANGTHIIKVVATDLAGRTSEQTSTVTLSRAAPVPDVVGPAISNINVNGVALTNGTSFVRNAELSLTAIDRSGVGRVELLVDGVVSAFGGDVGNNNYRVQLNLDGIANGSHTLTIRAIDSLVNVSNVSYTVSISHAAPEAPTLNQPVNGLITRNEVIEVVGIAQPNSSVQLFNNGKTVGSVLTAANDGSFSGTVNLLVGANQIQATSADSYGISVKSSAVLATLDITVPASPKNLVALAQAAGVVRLNWTRSTDPNATGYDIYRAPNIFTAINEAVKINSNPLEVIAFDDLPPQDASWTYRVVAVNNLGTPSLPTNAVQANSDSTAPKAISIEYSTAGKIDIATGRFGQGRVTVTVTTSEPLLSPPYLSIVPQGGVPIPVDLTSTAASKYSGGFLIDSNTLSGTANALFSARDAVGNRGTDVDVGATLKIDTDGPHLVGIVLSPASPIKNDPAKTVQATFSFIKAPIAIPTVKYLLSGASRSPTVVSGLTQLNASTYTANFTLPADGGLASPEALTFSFQSQDDLGNFSTKVSALNRFQVYQGNLPPLEAPAAFVAKARPAGKVRLSWQAVEEAFGYQIFRQGPGQATLQPLSRASGIDYIDQTPQDGAYKYAIATIRQSNAQESVSSQSAAVDVTTSATAPGAPQNLALQLTGQGIYATWQPPLASTVDYYNLYRTTGTKITTIDGLTPYKTLIKNPVTYDTNPSPTQGAYVVTALDSAGNESAISNSVYLNASLLPVRNLKVEQISNNLPIISWEAPNGNITGYLVYVGSEVNTNAYC